MDLLYVLVVSCGSGHRMYNVLSFDPIGMPPFRQVDFVPCHHG